MVKIVQWRDIVDAADWNTLVLGNGASMAVCPQFGYEPLLEAATRRGFISKDVETIFSELHTKDFELVMGALRQTSRINELLGVQDDLSSEAYSSLREALIKTVKEVHPQHEHVYLHLDAIGSFMKPFQTVLCLNYDLIVYWAIMEWMNKERNRLKDGFLEGEFQDDWEWLRTPYPGTDGATLVFYPHGNLALASDLFGDERKIARGPDDSRPLLEVIAERWRDDRMVPMFVSEGGSQQKRRTIARSRYLNIVYREVLPRCGSNVVTYGWSFGEQDRHIIRQLFNKRNNPRVERVAVSVFRGQKPDHVIESDCQHMRKEILQASDNVTIDFFDATSPGVWVQARR